MNISYRAKYKVKFTDLDKMPTFDTEIINLVK